MRQLRYLILCSVSIAACFWPQAPALRVAPGASTPSPGTPYAALSATTFTGIASLKLDSDPLGSPEILNDLAEALDRPSRWNRSGRSGVRLADGPHRCCQRGPRRQFIVPAVDTPRPIRSPPQS